MSVSQSHAEEISCCTSQGLCSTVGRHVSLTGTSLWLFHVFQSRTPRLDRRNKVKWPDYSLSCKRPSVVARYYGTFLWRTVIQAQKLVNLWEANEPKSYSRNKRRSCPWTHYPSTTEWPVVNFAPRIACVGEVNTVNESTGSGNRYKSHNNDPICSYNAKGWYLRLNGLNINIKHYIIF